MTRQQFIALILDAERPTQPAKAAVVDATPSGDAVLFDASLFGEPPAATSVDDGIGFARTLLEGSGFGDGRIRETATVILGDNPAKRSLPQSCWLWPRTPERPHRTLLFQLENPGSVLLDDSLFREQRQQKRLEDALHRLIQTAQQGFAVGGGKRTADVEQGKPEETLILVSVEDDRKRQSAPVTLVCFGTVTETTGAFEAFHITNEARQWAKENRALAEDHLSRLYYRHFEKLASETWQDAFVTGKERDLARKLLDVCTAATPDAKRIEETAVKLIRQIATSFGRGHQSPKIEFDHLPKDHFIGADPKAAERPGFENDFAGMTVRDGRERLLGYIVYCLDEKQQADRLRASLAEHNSFHNVLVIYPDGGEATLELWQGKRALTGKLTKAGARFRGEGEVVNLLSRFFVVSKSEVASPAELARDLAYRASYLRIIALGELENERGLPETANRPVLSLYEVFGEALARLSETKFADAYAQTLTYGLLAARWMARGSDLAFTVANVARLLPRSSQFFIELFEQLVALHRSPRLGWLIEDLVSLLHRTAVEEVFADDEDPVLHFYEDFLDAYDPEQRRERGVYYTPNAIVRYMVAHSDIAVTDSSPGRQSLTSGCIRILDPATGTGTFLREVVRYAVDSSDVVDPSDVVDALRGMEVMVAPYAICHLRISLAMESLPSSRSLAVRAHLTDTLELPLEPSPELFRESPALAREALAAKEVKEERAWTLVIGNPPYKNNSDYTLAQIAERFPRLLQSSRDAAAAQVRNIRDDYAWFFAAADSFTQAGGAICFVTSDSYLTKPSYQHFRREVLRAYEVRRVTRLGANIFLNVGPRIGFSIILMVRRSASVGLTAIGEPIDFIDISGLVTEVPAREQGTPTDPRLRWLDIAATTVDLNFGGAKVGVARPCEQNEFQFIASDELAGAPSLPLQVVAKSSSGYESIFIRKWPGIITAFDCLFKAPTADRLRSRMRQFFETSHSLKQSDIVALAKECGCDDKQAERLHYLCREAKRMRLVFQESQVKPIFTGSIPDGCAWHPPLQHAQWLYYEPRFKIPRNTNPGKAAGWGWMQQWREPETHEEFPKLVFTTSTNTNHGFRAYVVDADWYTKLHGAASQQYHYVTLTDPTQSPRLGGGHNNLTSEGEALIALLNPMPIG